MGDPGSPGCAGCRRVAGFYPAIIRDGGGEDAREEQIAGQGKQKESRKEEICQVARTREEPLNRSHNAP